VIGINVVLPISPLYVEKAVIIPIVKGRCEEAKRNIDSLRDTVSRMREYFIFDVAEYFGILKERYAPRIASCLGGRLTLDVIYLLDTDDEDEFNSDLDEDTVFCKLNC